MSPRSTVRRLGPAGRSGGRSAWVVATVLGCLWQAFGQQWVHGGQPLRPRPPLATATQGEVLPVHILFTGGAVAMVWEPWFRRPRADEIATTHESAPLALTAKASNRVDAP